MLKLLATSLDGSGQSRVGCRIFLEPYGMIQSRSKVTALMIDPSVGLGIKLWASIISDKQKTKLKICGVTRGDDLQLVAKHGVEWVGFNFYAGSKRYLTPAYAGSLWSSTKAFCKNLRLVAVFVDPEDALVLQALEAIPDLAAIQLHGREPPSRLTSLRSLIGGHRQLWKAIPVASPIDVEQAAAFAGGCDLILFDSAQLASGQMVAGGSGVSFTWDWLSRYQGPAPFGIAGGIDTRNITVASALRVAGHKPHLIDVASGAEAGVPGVKDPLKVAALVAALREA